MPPRFNKGNRRISSAPSSQGATRRPEKIVSLFIIPSPFLRAAFAAAICITSGRSLFLRRCGHLLFVLITQKYTFCIIYRPVWGGPFFFVPFLGAAGRRRSQHKDVVCRGPDGKADYIDAVSYTHLGGEAPTAESVWRGLCFQLSFAAVMEEPLFRAFLPALLESRGLRPAAAVLACAAIFWLGHAYYIGTGANFWVVIPLASLLLGLVARRTGSMAWRCV